MSSRFSINQSILVIIDVQGKLATLVQKKDPMLKNILNLIQACHTLEIPIIYTEQMPEKIGETIAEIKHLLPNQKPISKESFSCCGAPDFTECLIKSGRKQIIVAGIEAHVCVVQTVLDLLEREFEVQAVADAISSRNKQDCELALERMKQSGADITSAEMLLTELIVSAKHKHFKDILGLMK